MTKDKIKITTTRAARPPAAATDPWLQVPAFFLPDDDVGEKVWQGQWRWEGGAAEGGWWQWTGQRKTYRHISITLCMMLKIVISKYRANLFNVYLQYSAVWPLFHWTHWTVRLEKYQWKVQITSTHIFWLISPEGRMIQCWKNAPSYIFRVHWTRQSWSYFTATFHSWDISNVCKFNPLTDVTASRKCWEEAPEQIIHISKRPSQVSFKGVNK